jgi:hypothetical protein
MLHIHHLPYGLVYNRPISGSTNRLFSHPTPMKNKNLEVKQGYQDVRISISGKLKHDSKIDI